MATEPIYHICTCREWKLARGAGTYGGSSQDLTDGYIHFSSASQVRESAAKHRTGQDDLVLLTVDPSPLGDALKWEPSRGGQLFPHLYGRLVIASVQRADPLPLGNGGTHLFPQHVAERGKHEG